MCGNEISYFVNHPIPPCLLDLGSIKLKWLMDSLNSFEDFPSLKRAITSMLKERG